MVAAVKGRPGLVLLALLLALVFWRVMIRPRPDPKLAAVRAVQLTDADTKVPEPTPPPSLHPNPADAALPSHPPVLNPPGRRAAGYKIRIMQPII